MCFEFEIPHKMRYKNKIRVDEEDLENDPELEKVEEPITITAN
jgi:hypothetical protein